MANESGKFEKVTVLIPELSPFYDQETFDRTHRVIERARDDAMHAQADQPSEVSENYDVLSACEQDIVKAGHSGYEVAITHLRNKLAELREQIAECKKQAHLGFEGAIHEFKGNLHQLRENHIDNLVMARADAINAGKSLNLFKRENRLNRNADYPESFRLSLAWISIIIVVEGVFNAGIFMEAGSGGLLVGFILAMAFSAVNVSMSFIAGLFAYRQLIHSKAWRRFVGGFFVVVHGVVTVTLNLAVAYYRSVLESNPDMAGLNALAGFTDNPFQIDSIWGFVLFFLGMIISVVAVWKGIKFDDAYPGYGPMDRAYRMAEARYSDIKKEMLEKLHGFVSGAHNDLAGKYKVATENAIDIQKAARKALDLIDGVVRAKPQIQLVCNSAIKKYREEHRAIVGNHGSVPGYFSAYYPEIDQVPQPIVTSDLEVRHADFEQEASSSETLLDSLNKAYAIAREKLDAVFEAEANQGQKDYLESIETLARDLIKNIQEGARSGVSGENSGQAKV